VSDTSGDRIVQRALAPLPDLSTIVFFRKANRDFVTGRGPIAAQSGNRARAFMRGGMWLFLVSGLLITLLVGVMEIGRRQNGLEDLDVIYIAIGPVLLFLALVYWFFSWSQSRRAAKEQRLSAEGGLLPAELTGIKYISGSGDNNVPSLRVDYRFTTPDGGSVNKRQHLSRFDFTRKTLPPEGSKVLVLYVDAETLEVL
jgi:hypothetical protein